jgi:hypothetical protein
MKPIEELKKNIDFKNLGHSDLVLMYDLLLMEFPYLQGNIEATLMKMREVYGVDLTERQIMSIQDVDLNSEIEDLKLYANK